MFKLISLLWLIVLISYCRNYAINKGHSFISLGMNQSNEQKHNGLGDGEEKTVDNSRNSNKDKELFKTAIINQSKIDNKNESKVIVTPSANEVKDQSDGRIHQPDKKDEELKQEELQQEKPQSKDEIINLQNEISSILDNIKILGSELITTSSSSKDILKEIDDLQNSFAKMQFEITTDSNEQHKRIGILNDRLSSHLKQQLTHQLFLTEKTEEEINSSIKTDEAALSSLEHEIYLNTKCSSYQSCSQCATDSSCGWCISTDKCVEGDSERPLFTQCQSYSFSICDKEALCSQTTCGVCIANSICSWCATSHKPYCSKEIDNNHCDKDLIINILGDNTICPMVNYKLKYEGGPQPNFLKENLVMEKRKQLKEKYTSIAKGIEIKNTRLDDFKKQKEAIKDQLSLIDQQKEDFDIIEEDKNQQVFSDGFRIKMMNVFRTELQTFLENLKKKINQH